MMNHVGLIIASFLIFRVAKLKTLGNIGASAQHTFRERPTPNADKQRTYLNQHAGARTSGELVAKFRARIPEDRRSDAVLGIEMFMGASPDWMRSASNQERSEFFSRCRLWLIDTFGKENVLYFGTQEDESTPHAVGYVLPLKDGKLNAKHWLGGSEKLSALQDSIARVMGGLGLERGVRGSDSHHQPVRRFYGTLNEGMDRAVDRLDKIHPEELETVDELQRYARDLEFVLWEQEVELALEKRKHELRFDEELRSRTNMRYASEGTFVGRIVALARDYCIQAVEGIGHVLHSLRRYFSGATWHDYLKSLHQDADVVAFTYDDGRGHAVEAEYLARRDPEFRARHFPGRHAPIASERNDWSL